jgi:CRISPR-associated protein Csb1
MSYDQKRARPLNWPKIYAALFKYDPNTLIHGVFLSLLGDGRVRVPRALAGFIEARNVERVVYGGVKNSPVDPSGKIRAGGGSDDPGVYSNVPYARIEYTAENITAYFNLDLALIRGYRLGDDATQLLTALSLLKIRRFLDAHLRLRTACDFACKRVTAPALPAFSLPADAELLNDVQAGIAKCAPAFPEPRITELNTPVKRFEKADKKSATTAGGPTQ